MRTATCRSTCMLHVQTLNYCTLRSTQICSDDAECGQAARTLSRPERAWPARRDDTRFTASMLAVTRYTGVQAQVGFGRVYFPGPNRVGARAHFMRWAQPILRLSRRACTRANDGLAGVNAGQPLMKNLSHFVKSVLYIFNYISFFTLNCRSIRHCLLNKIKFTCYKYLINRTQKHLSCIPFFTARLNSVIL